MAEDVPPTETYSSADEAEGFPLTLRNKKMTADSEDPEGCSLCYGPREEEWRNDLILPSEIRLLSNSPLS